jgi:UDP-3-O-[3-hydroxymyristoyl] glucosamine N-acyltransferase
MPKTLKEIAKFINGELVGDGEITIKEIKSIEEARDGDLSVLVSSKYTEVLAQSKASAFLVPKDIKNIHNRNVIKVDFPSVALSKVIALVMPEAIPHPKGIHKTAIISESSFLGSNVAIGPYVVVSDNAAIGDNTIIYPYCYVGKGSKIGSNCLFYPNVVIREMVVIGNRVIIHPGTVIGGDGFGYDTQKDGTHFKIPQLGTVVVEDDVEIGACVTVDRARFDKTVIGKGSKIDNLCQIAHNVIIGPYCLIAAQSGIAGSTTIGRNVVFGGQVGVADHVKIGDFVMAGAKTGISKSFPIPHTVLFGYPARPVDKARDMIACTGLLPKLFARVRALEKKIKELKKK